MCRSSRCSVSPATGCCSRRRASTRPPRWRRTASPWTRCVQNKPFSFDLCLFVSSLFRACLGKNEPASFDTPFVFGSPRLRFEPVFRACLGKIVALHSETLVRIQLKTGGRSFVFLFVSNVARRPLRRLGTCVKTAFLSHLYIKTNILPRQARDKHRESSKRDGVFSGCHEYQRERAAGRGEKKGR